MIWLGCQTAALTVALRTAGEVLVERGEGRRQPTSQRADHVVLRTASGTRPPSAAAAGVVVTATAWTSRKSQAQAVAQAQRIRQEGQVSDAVGGAPRRRG